LVSQLLQKPKQMLTKIKAIISITVLLISCSPKNISTKYYYENEKVLDKIEESYKKNYAQTPFNVGFSDRSFNTVSLEIITDTLSYIYEFAVNEPRLTDTLLKYKLKPVEVTDIIKQMQGIRCAWINQSDYYVDEKKHALIFMSIKPVALKRPFAYSKYYVLTYFQQPQYFDSEGRLLHKRKLKELRKINGEIFKRINSKVCYTISGRFR
jgi:hypothetical protein